MNTRQKIVAGGIIGLSALIYYFDKSQTYTEENPKGITNNSQLEERLELFDLPKSDKQKAKQVDYSTNDFKNDSDKVIIARMLFGEARNCSREEKRVIAYTAINRAKDGKKWNGETIKDSILKEWQYSCFNDNDPNKKKLMDPQRYDSKSWEECLTAADTVLGENSNSYNLGQTHYHTLAISPKWAGSKLMERKILNSTI